MEDAQPDPLNLSFLKKDYVMEGMTAHLLGLPMQNLRDGKHCTQCLDAPSKLFSCAKCHNPNRLYCSRVCQKRDWRVHKQSCGKVLCPLKESMTKWLNQYSEVASLAQQQSGMPHIIIYLFNRHHSQNPGPPFSVSRIEKYNRQSLRSEDSCLLRYARSTTVRCIPHPNKPSISVAMPAGVVHSDPTSDPAEGSFPYWESALRVLSTLDLPNLTRPELHSVWRVLNRKLSRLQEEEHGGWTKERLMRLNHFKDLKPADLPDFLGVEDTVQFATKPSHTPLKLLLQSRTLVGKWFCEEIAIYVKRNNIRIRDERHTLELAQSTYETMP